MGTCHGVLNLHEHVGEKHLHMPCIMHLSTSINCVDPRPRVRCGQHSPLICGMLALPHVEVLRSLCKESDSDLCQRVSDEGKT